MSTPTVKQLASRHARRLDTLSKQVLEMSCEWDDVDQFNTTILEELHVKMQDVARDLKQTDSDVN
ncbi:MAG: hypothetical protein EPN79_02185 [Burkholderiaceae bacterium]|nr:MAG: hypothetical protein EPN79_02185 [Burkholderiaceae bacterium]TBR76155.1 MAG: hypothetical protein EPN64_09090 [Burkholderiaceae bacterium]